MAMAVVCDLMLRSIIPRCVDLSILGGVGSTVCGNVDLVRCAIGSYWSLVDGTLGADGAALGVCMTTLGSEVLGWTVSWRHIVRSTELRRLGFGRGGVTCAIFDKGKCPHFLKQHVRGVEEVVT